MWQKLGFPLLLVLAAAMLGATLYVSTGRSHRRAEEKKTWPLLYAQRLRDDGARLAREQRWDDAFARYEQAESYDDTELEGEPRRKLDEIREHVGEIVFDKEFEAREKHAPEKQE